MRIDLLNIKFLSERDVVLARQRAREIAALMGYDSHEQTRVATAVSEAVRDCLQHGGLDEVNFNARDTEQGTLLEIHINTSRLEPAQVTSLLSTTETLGDRLTCGLRAARRLVDQFSVEPGVGVGTTLVLGQFLPGGVRIRPTDAKRIIEQIARQGPQDAMQEVRQQNQELAVVLEEVRKRQKELIELNKELEDTNRGVLALHSEVEQRSEQLRKANDLKTRFMSEMSHEFRTPINSILSLCQILLDRMDGDLTTEQEKQVSFIKKSADSLFHMVNALLDLAKIEAGKIDVEQGEFEVGDLFSELKGVMKPLTTEAVALVFEDPPGLPALFTDKAKVAQILRNLISNAIKFTEQGEIRVFAVLDPIRDAIVFSVGDTGIGMTPEQQDIVFQEYVQVRGPMQKKSKGTGLGLPLSRKLAELLGGSLSCKSILGQGSTFLATIPVRYEQGTELKKEPTSQEERGTDKGTVLVVEDDPETVFIYRKLLRDSGFLVMDAATVPDARQILSLVKPEAIILDIVLGEAPYGWAFLAELKDNEATRDIPVLVVTVLEERERAMLLGAHDFLVKPIDPKDLVQKLRNYRHEKKLLIIDDEEVSRYIMRGLLGETPYVVIEAENGEEGLAKALNERPDVITLDLIMPGMNGFEVLNRLKADPRTRDIPVIIVTSKQLTDEEHKELQQSSFGVLSKHASSREETISQLSDALLGIVGQ